MSARVFEPVSPLPGDRRITLPADLEGRVPLFKALAQALALPSWFGHNFDALADVLSMPAPGRTVLVHPDVPDLSAKDLSIYLEVLDEAHAATGLLVEFPPATRVILDAVSR